MMMLMWLAQMAHAAELRVAVASNFKEPVEVLARRFETSTTHRVHFSFGSTGKLYAQIRNGAPFDLFLAADADRPARLEKEGLALPETRFTYAVGRLVLWSPQEGDVDAEGKVLETGAFRHLAIANPRLAPYGQAAVEVLRKRELWEKLQGRLVQGENIAQTHQFVHSGNAELGLLAYSQVIRPGKPVVGSVWVIPQSLHTPLRQQAVLLKESKAGRTFLDWLRGEEARLVIKAHGYESPD